MKRYMLAFARIGTLAAAPTFATAGSAEAGGAVTCRCQEHRKRGKSRGR
jgi:hypothetical protein